MSDPTEQERKLLFGEEELKKIEDIEAKARVEQEKEDSDLITILNTPQGRRQWWRFFKVLGLTRSPFVHDSLGLTGFKAGQHDFALKLLADMERVRPGTWSQMTNEYVSSQQSDKQGQK